MATTNFSGPVASEQGFTSGGPVKLKSYAFASVPSASANTGALIYCSNATGGATVAYSNGTNWLRVDTSAILS
jgi:hypothetical protein